jgi:hypothetical protein
MATKQKPQPPAQASWTNSDGSPSLPFFQYMKSVDTLLAGLAGGVIGPLTTAANDAAAAAAGVAVGGLYSNSGSVRIRLV